MTLFFNRTLKNSILEPYRSICIYLIFLTVCFFTYKNSLYNGFLMDDYPMVIKNPLIGTLSFLQLDFNTQHSQVYFRPVIHFFNLITYILFEENPLGYHLFSIGLFYLGGVFLYRLLKSFFECQKTAALTTLFFYMHPINGIVVNYKNAVGYAFLILAVILSLTKFLNAFENRENVVGDSFLGGIWFVLALLCHETVIIFPLYLITVLIFVKKVNLKRAIRGAVPAGVISVFYLIFRMYYSSLNESVIQNITSYNLTIFSYSASFCKLMFWYFSKLFFLQGIVLAWDAPPVENVFLWNTVFVLFILGISFFFYRFSGRFRRESLALSWILIGFIPVTLACFSRPKLGFVIQPHWLFFSSIGYFLLLASLFSRLYKHVHKILWWGTLVSLLSFYMMNAHYYNYLWGDQKRYCQKWLVISPHNYWPNYWLGYAYLEEKEYAKAKRYFLKIAGRGLKLAEVLGNLGIIEKNLGSLDLAMQYFRQSLKQNISYADTYYYMGDIYFTKGLFKDAEKMFNEAIRRDRYLYDSWEKLAKIYRKQGRSEDEQAVYKEMKLIFPEEKLQKFFISK
ncbi:hypothetical protein MNBD_UNCLBAC01-70 [hydrothermal vent metagenome]|uniref:Uncharacterized protein n=1 Tax=hydrothermal vent metagenome TaxID=652676 RepID=A0A3B1E340_9ZZZZ